MLNITFVLKDKGANNTAENEKTSKKETPVICYIRYNGERLKYPTGERILPKHWEDRKKSLKYQRAKGSLIGSPEFNARLDSIEATVKTVFRKYQNEHNNQLPSISTLRDLLNLEFKRITETDRTFIGFFKALIDQSVSGVRLHPKTGRPISKNTIKTYNTTFKHLVAYQQTLKRPLNFENIDLDFYDQYTEHLIKGKELNPKTGKKEPLNLSTNTIAKHFQIIKLILNEATDRGINNNRTYKSSRFAVIREKSDSIYLTRTEIAELENLDLTHNKKLDRTRDLFLIGYYTGQRYSDYSTIDPTKITTDEDGDQFIEITQIKTDNAVHIPVHPQFKRILEKHGGKLPLTYSNQKANEYLKEIGKLLTSLHAPVAIGLPTQGGLKAIATYPKYELITTHTARRSFATNHYLEGWSTLTIMNITGHRTEKSFMTYIKLTTKEHAKIAHAGWKRSNTTLKAVANISA